jgi:hypothetical protein
LAAKVALFFRIAKYFSENLNKKLSDRAEKNMMVAPYSTLLLMAYLRSKDREKNESFQAFSSLFSRQGSVTFCFFVFVMFFLKTPVKYVEASDYGITNA